MLSIQLKFSSLLGKIRSDDDKLIQRFQNIDKTNDFEQKFWKYLLIQNGMNDCMLFWDEKNNRKAFNESQNVFVGNGKLNCV
jgi:hypothetical protein